MLSRIKSNKIITQFKFLTIRIHKVNFILFLVIMPKQENEGSFNQNMNILNSSDMKEKSVYPTPNMNIGTNDIRNPNFHQETNPTYDNFNQNLKNLNMMNQSNMINENLQMGMANKNMQMNNNNVNNSYNQMKNNNLMHMIMNNPNISAQQNLNIANFSRAGKI